MLVAIFLSIYLSFNIFSGGGTEQFGILTTDYVESQIKTFVTDTNQRKQALNELDAFKKDIDALNKLIEQDMKKFTDLIEDYHSTPADFDQQLAAVSMKNKEQFDKLWVDRQALLSHIQHDEWAKIIAGALAETHDKELISY